MYTLNIIFVADMDVTDWLLIIAAIGAIITPIFMAWINSKVNANIAVTNKSAVVIDHVRNQVDGQMTALSKRIEVAHDEGVREERDKNQAAEDARRLGKLEAEASRPPAAVSVTNGVPALPVAVTVANAPSDLVPIKVIQGAPPVL